MNNMKIVYKRPSEIKVALYNPKTRTKDRNLGTLKKSIMAYGILVPILLDKQSNLIDGHRRLKIAKQLKMATIPSVESTTKLTRDEAFETINTTQKKISNNDMIYIYVKKGRVPEKALKTIQEMEQVIGRRDLVKIGNSYVTYKVMDYAKMISRYCKISDSKFIHKTIMWLVDKKMIFTVRRAMENKAPKKIIINAINKNTVIKTTYKA